MNSRYEAMVRRSQKRGFLPPERVQAKVQAFTEWTAERTPEEKQFIKDANNILCAHLHDMGPVSATELLAELFLFKGKRRRNEK